MAVVIRLRGLPLFAAPVDIRRFFTGLTIPDGGVHIIGGEMGEAFIIFATDEDARRAVSRSGGFIMDSSVELFLSSKAEMQKTIEMKRTDCAGRERPGSGTAGGGGLSNVEALKEEAGNSEYVSPLNRDAGFHANGTGHGDLKPRKTRPSKAENPYLFLRGLPYLVNEEDVRVFFAGLWVDGVIFLKHHDGRNNGDAIVKFASCIDASGGLKCHRSFMGSRFIEVMQGSEEQWIEFGGNAVKEGNVPAKAEEQPPAGGSSERHSRKRSHSKSPRTRSRSPHGYYVQLKNLSLSVNKRDLKNFFRDTELASEQIKFLYKEERRTRIAFVVFKTLRDYNAARGLHKTPLQHRPVHIDPISRKDMLKLIKFYEKKRAASTEKERLERGSQKYAREGCSGQKLCIYIRNFPFDVTKMEVQKFFADFALAEEEIHLLFDDKGVGLGEALVKFPSEEQAKKAERLNRRRFLGTEVLLRLISEAQMQEFGVNFPAAAGERMHERSRSRSRDRDDYFQSFESDEPPAYSGGPSENYRRQPEDARQPDSYKHPQGDFRQPDRYPPKDFRHSAEDFSYSPEDFRHPREEHFRRLPEEDFRHPREDDYRHAREEGFGRHWEDDWRRPPEEDFRPSSEEDWRRPAQGDFRRPPEESFRRPPKEDFRHYAKEEFRRSPEEDFRPSPKEDFKRPPQDHFRRPPPDHFRRPPQQHFRRPPQEHFRRPPQEHSRRPSQEHFRRPPQEHFRRPPQEHFRRSREENFRHPPDEDYRGPADEDFRHPPDEDFRSSQEEGFRRPSDEDFRRLPEEDVREAPEDDSRLADSFRSHRSVANVGRPEGGKFDFGKRNMGSFPEGRFVPDPKLNCSSSRVTPLKVMNLPFKANVNEILDFFHGYRIIPDSVSIQYNEQGLPIGEAIVAMANYSEAMAAIKDLNDRPVGSRKVKLTLL